MLQRCKHTRTFWLTQYRIIVINYYIRRRWRPATRRRCSIPTPTSGKTYLKLSMPGRYSSYLYILSLYLSLFSACLFLYFLLSHASFMQLESFFCSFGCSFSLYKRVLYQQYLASHIYCVPRSSDPFYTVSYYMKWVTTSLTDSTWNFLNFPNLKLWNNLILRWLGYQDEKLMFSTLYIQAPCDYYHFFLLMATISKILAMEQLEIFNETKKL